MKEYSITVLNILYAHTRSRPIVSLVIAAWYYHQYDSPATYAGNAVSSLVIIARGDFKKVIRTRSRHCDKQLLILNPEEEDVHICWEDGYKPRDSNTQHITRSK